jgi:DNA-binding CsgD family transcriptional regulator
MISAIAAAVSAVDEDNFPDKLLHAFRVIAGTDLCSAFRIEEDGSLRYLFAGGNHPAIPGFAEIASLDYARRYWQRDRVTRQMLATNGTQHSLRVIRQAWNGITDPEYRRACYERAQIVERLTLYQVEESRIFASAYRTRTSGPSSSAEMERLEAYAPILIAAVAKHAGFRFGAMASVLHPPAQEVIGHLLNAGCSLSLREAEVSAGMLLGMTQKEISQDCGVAMSSIVTYRQRAYRKLGVANRRGLTAFYQTLAHAG